MNSELKDWLDKGAQRLPYRAPPPADPPASAGDEARPLAPWVTGPLQFGGKVAEGLGKSLASAPGASYIEPKSVSDWAKSEDDWPIAQGIGRQLPAIGTALAMPEISALTGLARVAAQMGLGGLGGAMESRIGQRTDMGRGAAEGAGTAGATALAEAVASRLPGVLGPAAAAGIAGMHHVGHGFGPYLAWKATHYLAHPAMKGLHWLANHPGALGAFGEWAAKQTGYEDDEDQASGNVGQGK